jgi:hypothetical protein
MKEYMVKFQFICVDAPEDMPKSDEMVGEITIHLNAENPDDAKSKVIAYFDGSVFSKHNSSSFDFLMRTYSKEF